MATVLPNTKMEFYYSQIGYTFGISQYILASQYDAGTDAITYERPAASATRASGSDGTKYYRVDIHHKLAGGSYRGCAYMCFEFSGSSLTGTPIDLNGNAQSVASGGEPLAYLYGNSGFSEVGGKSDFESASDDQYGRVIECSIDYVTCYEGTKSGNSISWSLKYSSWPTTRKVYLYWDAPDVVIRSCKRVSVASNGSGGYTVTDDVCGGFLAVKLDIASGVYIIGSTSDMWGDKSLSVTCGNDTIVIPGSGNSDVQLQASDICPTQLLGLGSSCSPTVYFPVSLSDLGDEDAFAPDESYTVTATCSDACSSTTVTAQSGTESGYSQPAISSVSAIRAAVDGNGYVESDDGEVLKLVVEWSIQTTSSQTTVKTFTVAAEDADGNAVSLTQQSVSGTGGTTTLYFTNASNDLFSADKRYSITVTVGDKFNTTWKSAVLSIAYFTMDALGDRNLYNLTTDSSVNSSKIYYMRSGSGTSSNPYVYTPVANPTANGLAAYYEANGAKPGHGISFGVPATHEGFDVHMPQYSYGVRCFQVFEFDTAANADANTTIPRPFYCYCTSDGGFYRVTT